jgi:hypothetical protein
MGSEIRGSVRLFLTLTGVSLIVAGVAYLLFPHAAVGIVGIELLGTAAAIDARATYGGTQLAMGLFLLSCRAREDAAHAGLVLIFLVGGCLALARIYGFAIEGESDAFNAIGAVAESGLAAGAAFFLRGLRSSRSRLTEAKADVGV